MPKKVPYTNVAPATGRVSRGLAKAQEGKRPGGLLFIDAVPAPPKPPIAKAVAGFDAAMTPPAGPQTHSRRVDTPTVRSGSAGAAMRAARRSR